MFVKSFKYGLFEMAKVLFLFSLKTLTIKLKILGRKCDVTKIIDQNQLYYSSVKGLSRALHLCECLFIYVYYRTGVKSVVKQGASVSWPKPVYTAFTPSAYPSCSDSSVTFL